MRGLLFLCFCCFLLLLLLLFFRGRVVACFFVFFGGCLGFFSLGFFCGGFLQCIGFIHVLLIPELVISKIYVLTVLKFISYSYIIFSKVV